MANPAEVENLDVHTEEGRDPNSRTLLYVGVIGIVLLVATVFGTQAFTYRNQVQQTQEYVYDPGLPDLAHVRAEQLNQISQLRWVDRPQGVVAIPIDQAMQTIVADVKAGKPLVTIRPAPATQLAVPPATQGKTP